MSIQYTAEYTDRNGVRFRCYVECGPMGWVATIFDQRPANRKSNRPSMIFGDFVEDPETGKTMVQGILPWFARREHLSAQPLQWNESCVPSSHASSVCWEKSRSVSLVQAC
jgi:hypothetical protein